MKAFRNIGIDKNLGFNPFLLREGILKIYICFQQRQTKICLFH